MNYSFYQCSLITFYHFSSLWHAIPRKSLSLKVTNSLHQLNNLIFVHTLRSNTISFNKKRNQPGAWKCPAAFTRSVGHYTMYLNYEGFGLDNFSFNHLVSSVLCSKESEHWSVCNMNIKSAERVMSPVTRDDHFFGLLLREWQLVSVV